MGPLESLLAPVSVERPSGEALEFEVAELEALVESFRPRDSADAEQDARSRNEGWREVRDRASSLLLRTKNLRVAVRLTQAELRLRGWRGFADGVMMTSELLVRYWSDIHPVLDPDEVSSAIDRVNVLSNLAEPENVLQIVRQIPIVQSREVGTFSLRHLDLSAGRISPKADEIAPTLEALDAAWRTGNRDQNAENRQAVLDACKSLQVIDQCFMKASKERFASGAVTTLEQYLNTVAQFFSRFEEPVVEIAEANSDIAPPGPLAQAIGKVQNSSQNVDSREDAIKRLKLVSEYLKKSEPSSPAPLFIDRAVRIMELDFAGIVSELMPDGVRAHLELLSGKKLEN